MTEESWKALQEKDEMESKWKEIVCTTNYGEFKSTSWDVVEKCKKMLANSPPCKIVERHLKEKREKAQFAAVRKRLESLNGVAVTD